MFHLNIYIFMYLCGASISITIMRVLHLLIFACISREFPSASPDKGSAAEREGTHGIDSEPSHRLPRSDLIDALFGP